MKTLDIDQIALPPEESTPETVRKIRVLIEQEDNWLPRRLVWKQRIAALLHPLGIHHWVTWRQYHEESNRLLVMGIVCQFCDRGRMR